jgi:hypothetical protein
MAMTLSRMCVGNTPPPRGSLKPLIYGMVGMGAYGFSRGIRSVLEVGERAPHVVLTHGVGNGFMYANPITIIPSFKALLQRLEVGILHTPPNDPDLRERYRLSYYEWNGLPCSCML